MDYIVKHNAEDADILSRIKVIYFKNKRRYGYIRVNLDLNKQIHINQKRTQRIMRENNLKGFQGSNKKYHSYKGDNGEAKVNLLLDKIVDKENNKISYKPNFSTTKPNEKWTTDVSEFKIHAGKLYLSPILDMYDNMIISYDISESPNFEQTKRMLDGAFALYPNLENLTIQSDQGWQYQMFYYKSQLEEKGIKQSFSRKGNCMDNGIMESFFGIMKNEMFYGHEDEFKTVDELKQAMIEYINYYNTERINKKRKGLSPIAYRQQYFSLNNMTNN